MAKPSNILISTMKRNQRFRGPASSADQNSFQEEVIRDFTAIQQQYNSFIVPLTKTLPDGSIDVNAFQNGLDGRTIYTHAEAVNAGADVRYYNSLKGRPNTIYEQFLDTYAYIDSAIEALERDLVVSGTGGGLTTQQKERIGLNVFDSSLSSSPTSIDGRSSRNELNILQLAKDVYGSSYVNFNGVGDASLNNSVRAMVDALLELHNGDWDSDISLSHNLSASDITTGTMAQNRVGPSSTAPGGVNDNFTGTPSNLVEDLNQLRNLLKTAKGTSSFSSAITPDATWSAVTTPPTNLTLTIALKGTGTRTDVNPWGYHYNDIEGLVTVLSAAQSYTGRTSLTDASPVYSNTLGFSNGDSLTAALGGLAGATNNIDARLTTLENSYTAHAANTFNPHQVTLTQAAAQGGTAPASQISLADLEGYYTSANVEDALEEIHQYVDTQSGVLNTKINTVSGDLNNKINALDTELTDLITTTSGHLQTEINELSVSTTFRRNEITVSGLAQASGYLVEHDLGMYPQVQFINLGAGGHIEPISQASGVWVQHTNNNSLTVYNYTGTTVNEGLILLTW